MLRRSSLPKQTPPRVPSPPPRSPDGPSSRLPHSNPSNSTARSQPPFQQSPPPNQLPSRQGAPIPARPQGRVMQYPPMSPNPNPLRPIPIQPAGRSFLGLGTAPTRPSVPSLGPPEKTGPPQATGFAAFRQGVNRYLLSNDVEYHHRQAIPQSDNPQADNFRPLDPPPTYQEALGQPALSPAEVDRLSPPPPAYTR